MCSYSENNVDILDQLHIYLDLCDVTSNSYSRVYSDLELLHYTEKGHFGRNPFERSPTKLLYYFMFFDNDCIN